MEPIQIRVVNLNWKATQEEIATWVSSFVQMTDCKLITGYKKRSKGLCYITLKDQSSLEEALKHNEEEFMGRKVRITKAKPLSEKKTDLEKKERKQKTEKLPKVQKTEDITKNSTKKQKTDSRKKKNEQPISSQKIEESSTSGQAKEPTKPKVLKDKKLRLQNKPIQDVDQKPKPKKIRKVREPYIKMNDERSIFVSNLAWNTSELTLGRHFEKCGDIEMVKIVEDNFGRSRGFGFVEFEKKGILNMVETVQAAILLNEQLLDKRTIYVRVVDRTQKTRRRSSKRVSNNKNQ